MTWLTSKLFGPIAAAGVVGFVIQSIRIDGFPIYGPGLRGQLAECEAAQGRAREAAENAARAKFEEGRTLAQAEAERLRQGEDQRRADEAATLAALRAAVANLRRPPPPVIVPGAAPAPQIVELPPLPAECRLERAGLDEIQARLNAQRGR